MPRNLKCRRRSISEKFRWVNVKRSMLAATVKRHNLKEYLSDSLDRGPMLQQELHHFHSVLLTGNVKRSEAILCKET